MFPTLHEVSAKLALYSADAEHVLVMHYPRRETYGLPGGHVERNETPDIALLRELEEELNLRVENALRRDFFLSEGETGRIILGYTAVAPHNVSIEPTNPSREYAVWMKRDELANIKRISTEYKRFALENWPANEKA